MKRKGSLDNLNENTKKQKLNTKNEEEKNNPQSLFLNLFDYHIIQQIFIQLVTQDPTSEDKKDQHETNDNKQKGPTQEDYNRYQIIISCSDFSSTCKQLNLISKNTLFKFNIFENELTIQNIKYQIYLKFQYVKQKIRNQKPYKRKKKSNQPILKQQWLNKMLFYSSEHGFYDLIKPLVLNGANVNYEDEIYEVNNCISGSCDNGLLKTTKKLVKYGANINWKQYNQNTLLHIACQSDNLDLVKYLIEEQGLNINSQNDENETPLFTACYFGDIDIVKYLVSLNTDINHQNQYEETILLKACSSNNLKLIQYLLDLNLDINYVSGFDTTCIYNAYENRNFEIIEFLISKGADLSIKYKGKKKPFKISQKI